MNQVFRVIRQDDNGYRTCQSHHHTAEIAILAKTVREQLAGDHKQTFSVMWMPEGEQCQYCEGQNDLA